MLMSPLLLILIVLICLALGAVVAWWLHGRIGAGVANADVQQAARAEADLRAQLVGRTEELRVSRDEARRAGEGQAGLTATNQQLNTRVAELTQERDTARAETRTAEKRAAELTTAIETERARIAEERNSLEALRKQLRDDGTALTTAFEAIAGKLFEEKSAAFRQLSTDQLKLLLGPLEKQLGDLHTGVVDASKERDLLRKDIERITLSAEGLAKSLRGDSKVQGDWGEMTLEVILENSGLVKDESYTVQKGFTDDAGKIQKPDVVLWLPEKRQMIVDSKVSLTDYDLYVNEVDEVKRAAHLLAHVASVRKHIKDLSLKKYDHIQGLNSLDGVFMWVPIEGALIAAMQADKGMMAEAVRLKIYPVGPTMFRAAITIVERLWRFEKQNTSVKLIFQRAEQLYDKVRLFLEAMDDVGKSLGDAQKNYIEAKSRLLTGQGNVTWQLQKLLELGVKPKKVVQGEWAGTDDAEQIIVGLTVTKETPAEDSGTSK